ncbi:MAG: Trm112 family protein [Pseudomonadota bacterium]
MSDADPQLDRRMLEALICPRSHGTLRYDAARSELVSEAAKLAYPIKNSIPIMLIDQARVLE